MTKLRITKAEEATLTKRLRKWSYPQIFAALAFTSGLTGLDLILIDLVPFVDEVLLMSATGFLMNVLRLKAMYGNGDDEPS